MTQAIYTVSYHANEQCLARGIDRAKAITVAKCGQRTPNGSKQYLCRGGGIAVVIVHNPGKATYTIVTAYSTR